MIREEGGEASERAHPGEESKRVVGSLLLTALQSMKAMTASMETIGKALALVKRLRDPEVRPGAMTYPIRRTTVPIPLAVARETTPRKEG